MRENRRDLPFVGFGTERLKVSLSFSLRTIAAAICIAVGSVLFDDCGMLNPSTNALSPALVFGPGQYRFVDFVKVGVPFALLAMLDHARFKSV